MKVEHDLHEHVGIAALWNMIDPITTTMMIAKGVYWLHWRYTLRAWKYRRMARLWNSIPAQYRDDFYAQNRDYRHLGDESKALAHELVCMASEIKRRME